MQRQTQGSPLTAYPGTSLPGPFWLYLILVSGTEACIAHQAWNTEMGLSPLHPCPGTMGTQGYRGVPDNVGLIEVLMVKRVEGIIAYLREQ